MFNKISASLLVALTLAVMGNQLLAAQGNCVVVFPPDTSNVSEGIGDAVQQSIIQRIEGQGFNVVDHRFTEKIVRRDLNKDKPAYIEKEVEKVERVQGTVAGTTGEAHVPVDETRTTKETIKISSPNAEENTPLTAEHKHEITKRLQCAAYFDSSILRFGRMIQLSVAHRNIDGSLISGKVIDAKTEEDLAIAVPRVMHALLTGQTVEGTRDLDNATLAETDRTPNRFKLEKNFGLSIAQVIGAGEMRSSTMIGFNGRFEIKQLMPEINAGLQVGQEGDDDLCLFFNLAVNYYLTKTQVSPYLGLGAGIVFANRLENSDRNLFDTGWDFFPQVGVEFLRNTRMRLHADFRYLFHVTSTEEFGHAPTIMLGLNF